MSPRKPKKKKPKLPKWMETFRTNLRDTRRRLKVSQEELAKRTGQFGAGISAIERGQRPGITYPIALELAEGLGVSLDFLMGKTTESDATERPGKAKRIPQKKVFVESTWRSPFQRFVE